MGGVSTPRRPDRAADPALSGDRLWYVAYGSNLHAARLACYLGGGVPPGGTVAHTGCRDPRPPRRSLPVMLPGCLYFATRSPRWGGGRAFYDPDAAGETAARAYLLTRSQFSDIAAQEMYRAPGSARDLDLSEVVAAGRASVGSGRYETLVCPGALDGLPLVTFTAPWRVGELPPLAPSAPYLRHLAVGLLEAHGWSVARVARYLAACSGAAGHWAEPDIAALLAAPEEAGAGPVPAADAGPLPR
ncbi:histone deacetylase [Streptomyces buecherae]